MPLNTGTRLGPYEITAPLGAGGMGEVWRARDTRLGREVAIKALPTAFAQDPGRLARFEREAKLLASLSHPNIAGIHGLEDVGGARYLVLELVEGETLADRLARGPLPVDDALEVCREIAAGVEAAHENGVVHRDLKPGNVMITPAGGVKVLDFGLAKGAEATGSSSQLSASPTISLAATAAGVILGTAAYMSPEQARGRPVDRRTDIWSFGCVLYECLTGRQVFEGETVSDVMARILEREPDWSSLPASTPGRVRELLARCLTKDPRSRLRDIGEARITLGSAGEAKEAPAERATSGAVRGGTVSWRVAVIAALALAAVAVVVTLRVQPEPAPGPVRKLDLIAQDIDSDWFFSVVLSPDGRRMAYVSKSRIWVRDLDQLEPRAVADVDGLAPLCWSPDSRTLVFNDRKKLWRVPIEGSGPVALCDVPGTGSVIGASWSRSGTVAFSVWRGGMYQVAAGGGAPALFFDIDPATTIDFHAPSWLSNGELLYVVHWKNAADTTGGVPPTIALFDGSKQILVPGDFGGNEGSPLLTDTGKLLFVRRGTNAGIWAVPFDLSRRRPRGEPRLVASDAASVSVAADGSLLYMEGSDRGAPCEMIWVDRSGKVIETVGSKHSGLTDPVLSPDGRRIAFCAAESGNRDVWVHDLVRTIDTRITFDESREIQPEWFPSSSRLAFVEVKNMQSRILAVNADGSGGQSVLTPPAGNGGPSRSISLAPDGRSALRIVDEGGHGRLRFSPVLADGSLGPPQPILKVQPEPDIDDVCISPDGRLLAYATNDPGQPEVFVTHYPGGEGQWQVGTEGGRRPRWSRERGELFFISGSGPSRRALVAVKVDASQDPPIGISARLFEIDPGWLRLGEMPYDVAADGQRFLMIRESLDTDARPRRMVLVQNWEAEFAEKEKR